MLIYHILGWLTMAGIGVTTLGTARWAWVSGKTGGRSYLERVTAPKLSSVPLTLSSGTDYVGLI